MNMQPIVSSLNRDSKVVVTGGSGFLGCRIVAHLLNLGCEVTTIDLTIDSMVGRPALSGPGHRVMEIDLRDREAVLSVFHEAKPSLVIHLAALHFIPVCIAEPYQALSTNVLGTQSVLDACGTLAEPPGLVFASTADVYLPQTEPHSEGSPVGPDNVYGLSKLTGEHLVEIAARHGACRPIIARLFNLYGSKETNPHVIPEIVSQLRRSDTVQLGNTSPKRDFVEVSDAAETLCDLATLAPSGTVVNVGTGQSYSVEDVVKIMSELLGRRIRIEVDNSRYRVSDRPNLQNDPTHLRSLIPEALSTSLAQGLRQLLADEGLIQQTFSSSRWSGGDQLT